MGNGIRYSVENYILDPVFIAAFLLAERWIKREDLKLFNNETYSDFKILNNDQLQFIVDYIIKKVFSTGERDRTQDLKIVSVGGHELQIPKSYLFLNGHKLEEKLKETFPQLRRFKGEGELKGEVIAKIIDDIPEFLPGDLLQLLKLIQSQ